MKKLYLNIRDFYRSHNGSLYVSLAGPFAMGILHFVVLLISFNYIVLCYCIVSFILLLSRIWQYSIDKYNLKISHYVAGLVSMVTIIMPMGACFVLTILLRDKPIYFFDWFIYAYALYGSLKMGFAIKNLVSKNKTDYKFVISYIGLVAALYTLQMLEFHLLKSFGKNDSDYFSYAMQFITQDVIMIIVLVIIGIFIRKIIIKKKELRLEE